MFSFVEDTTRTIYRFSISFLFSFFFFFAFFFSFRLNSHLEALLASNCVYSLASGIVEMCYIHNNDEEMFVWVNHLVEIFFLLSLSLSLICMYVFEAHFGSSLSYIRPLIGFGIQCPSHRPYSFIPSTC